MNSHYEFISKQNNQMLTFSIQARFLRSNPPRRPSVWGLLIGRCGDILIECGFWMKRVSQAGMKENSVGI